MAQKEREFIKERQREGIELARKRGVKCGRAPLSMPENYSKIRELYLEGKLSSRKAGKMLGISHRTFLNWIRRKSL